MSDHYVGDRVLLNGCKGTVVRVLAGAEITYAVWQDFIAATHIVGGDTLEPLDEPRDMASVRLYGGAR